MSIDFGTDIYEEPLVAKTLLPEDNAEVSLRPHTLAEYIGQTKAKENLSVFIEAARRRTEPLDHVLLHGPPGLGKTTLAGIIAAEMGVNIRITSGPAIEKPGDLAALLTNLSENDILFVDEIHRLNRSVEEILYPAMEDYAIDIIIGKGPSANSIRLDLPKFTLIGATTRAGQLSAPLRDRFGVTLRLELYTPEELAEGDLPPTFYVYGTEDPFYRQFQQQYDVIRNMGISTGRIVLNGWPHGFGSDGGWVNDYAAWLESVFANKEEF